MVRAALDGSLHSTETVTHPIFGLNMPTSVEGVPSEVLNPRSTWSDGAAYDQQAAKLASMFRENIKKFGEAVPANILAAGPQG